MWPEIVRIERAHGAVAIDGFMGIPISKSTELTLFHVIDQLVIPNGFSVVRNSTISNISTERNSQALGRGLLLKGYFPPLAPIVDLRSMQSSLSSLHKNSTFASIFFEIEKPGIAYLGSVCGVTRGKFQFRCVSPSARQFADEETFDVSKCTRIDFLGEYETAIYLSSLYYASAERKTPKFRKGIRPRSK